MEMIDLEDAEQLLLLAAYLASKSDTNRDVEMFDPTRGKRKRKVSSALLFMSDTCNVSLSRPAYTTGMHTDSYAILLHLTIL